MDELTKELFVEKWPAILENFQTTHNIIGPTYNVFIAPLKVYDYKDKVLYLLFDKEYSSQILKTKTFIESNYKGLLIFSIEMETGANVDIQFLLPTDIESGNFHSGSDSKSNTENVTHYNRKKRGDLPFLNSNYTFDTFVVGDNNELAFNAAISVAEAPSTSYNPLFLHGGVGLGKTHLMHAIANHIADHNSDLKILYVTSETFTNELVEAIRNRSDSSNIENFHRKYRNIDVLLIDDIQFIIGKESTQEEFFHTFNDLYQNKKQIIISSDRSPKMMETLEDRLRSRFSMGLIVDIQIPKFETRMAILQKKAELLGFDIDYNILDYIARNIETNVRNLEGAVTKVMAASKLNRRELTMDLAEEALSDMINPNHKREVTVEFICELVADHFNTTVEQINSKTRKSEIVIPRQICMYLSRRLTNTSLTDIGKKMGGKDHSTVVHACDKIEDLLETEPDMRNTLEILNKKINPQT